MKLDRDYLKGLLEAFEKSEKPYTDIQELEKHGYLYKEDQFIFHLQILSDKGLVIPSNPRSGLGYSLGLNRDVSWSIVPLRLTAQAHEFLAAIRQDSVWNTIKSDFKEASIDTVISVSKQLAEGWAKKKVDSLLNES